MVEFFLQDQLLIYGSVLPTKNHYYEVMPHHVIVHTMLSLYAILLSLFVHLPIVRSSPSLCFPREEDPNGDFYNHCCRALYEQRYDKGNQCWDPLHSFDKCCYPVRSPSQRFEDEKRVIRGTSGEQSGSSGERDDEMEFWLPVRVLRTTEKSKGNKDTSDSRVEEEAEEPTREEVAGRVY
ncbi:unnamed protein product, partial [Amoebophrya sp. A25]|eukprot:GSA25T00025220001.1